MYYIEANTSEGDGMPYESLACPKCGSGDCQEVKPGTHFCNHCDNVFRLVPSSAVSGSIGACATCGVIAAGLCLSCNRYFCHVHQAVVWGQPRGRSELCAACLKDRTDRRAAAKQRRVREAAARSRRAGLIYLEKSARLELEAAKVPLMKLFYLIPARVSWFGIAREIEDNRGQIGRGWLLGDFDWATETGPCRSQTVFFAECTGLPAHSACFPGAFSASTHRDTVSALFGRVIRRTAHGYGVPINPGALDASYEELGEAIQQLAGTSDQHR
jgi:hypothetical protein